MSDVTGAIDPDGFNKSVIPEITCFKSQPDQEIRMIYHQLESPVVLSFMNFSVIQHSDVEYCLYNFEDLIHQRYKITTRLEIFLGKLSAFNEVRNFLEGKAILGHTRVHLVSSIFNNSSYVSNANQRLKAKCVLWLTDEDSHDILYPRLEFPS